MLQQTATQSRAAKQAFNAMAWKDQLTFLSDTVRVLADGTRKHLPGQWLTVDRYACGSDNVPSWYLAGPDGERIDLSINRNKLDKLNISGSVPNRNPDNSWDEGAGVEIQVTHARGVEVIAREISRRFLPDYRVALATATERRNNAIRYRDNKREVKARMLAAFGQTEREQDRDRELVHISGLPNVAYGNAQCSGDSVTLNLGSLPVDLAVAVAGLVKGWKSAAVKTA